MKSETRSGELLLAWYDEHRRDLPWRQTRDPYRVWISEVMLQQTRVDVVIPYYERWLATFPDIATLAAAESGHVLMCWEGLGYYARARNLHAAARLVREKHGGLMPRDLSALRALPGVGEYTAGAIASIAYNHATPAVDGNVRRVLCRLFDLARPSSVTLRKYAERLLDPSRPGDFNQAVMDFGATVCTPRAPACGTCPLSQLCLSYAHATVHRRPVPKRKKPLPHYRITSLVHQRDGAVVLEQRTEQGLLAGLWQFPQMPPAENARKVGEITHTFSHQRITYVVYDAPDFPPLKPHQQFVPRNATAGYPMSAAQRRIEKMISVDQRDGRD